MTTTLSSYDNTVKDFRAGDRVHMHPGTDCWMRGDRYGTIERVGKNFLFVRMDISGRLIQVGSANLAFVF